MGNQSIKRQHGINRRLKILFLSATLFLACITNAYAVGPRPDFGVTIGPAILCRDLLDMKFFYDYLSASFGPAYKREQGAYWFRAKAQLFGKDIKEIFISDQSSDWAFVGAIFNVKPDELAKAVQASAGTDFSKTVQGYQYSTYQSQGTSEIMWQANDAKLLCRRMIGRDSVIH
ncbi:MAG TPA: hypothetical protein VNW52_02275 [Burkholderiaceae bacterium]|jgi:hypothetical protein|nr:hypothetical protein [Burkholderiaceae bacterium]